MLYDEDDLLEPITGNQRLRCQDEDGCRAQATWRTEPADGGDPVPMCAWHILYGSSRWGRERRDEIARLGRLARDFGQENRDQGSRSSHVPELDERGRLGPADAENYILGVKRTTKMARGVFRRIGGLRLLSGGGDVG